MVEKSTMNTVKATDIRTLKKIKTVIFNNIECYLIIQSSKIVK
jgi:hypothetical protein